MSIIKKIKNLFKPNNNLEDFDNYCKIIFDVQNLFSTRNLANQLLIKDYLGMPIFDIDNSNKWYCIDKNKNIRKLKYLKDEDKDIVIRECMDFFEIYKQIKKQNLNYEKNKFVNFIFNIINDDVNNLFCKLVTYNDDLKKTFDLNKSNIDSCLELALYDLKNNDVEPHVILSNYNFISKTLFCSNSHKYDVSIDRDSILQGKLGTYEFNNKIINIIGSKFIKDDTAYILPHQEFLGSFCRDNIHLCLNSIEGDMLYVNILCSMFLTQENIIKLTIKD